MAFVIPEEKKRFPWFPIAVALVAFAAIGFGAYYLFFAPAPGIEVVIPAPLQNVSRLSFIDVDPSTVINSKGFRMLRSATGLLGAGTLGRQNPFLPL